MGARGTRLALLAWLCLIPRLVFAQASITGTVKDASGAVLPGVTVEASSDALIEKVRTVTTDGTGQYRIVDLRPGVYTVTCMLPGFSTFKREGVELTGSFTATINADMKVGSLEESVTVSGESPVVDIQNTRRETVLTAEVIAALPGTRAYGSLLNATPGLTVDNNGLAATPTMTFFTAHGGNTNEGRMTINGMAVAASFNGGGVSSLTYDTINVEEVSVLVSGGLGENETGGPTMNLVPKLGGNKFSGIAFLNTAGSWSTGDNVDDALRAINIAQSTGIIAAYDASGSFGGPIKRDRLWFYGSYRQYSTATPAAGNVHLNKYAGDPSHFDYLAVDDAEARTVQGRKIWSARLTGQVTPRNKVTFLQENQYRCEGSTLTTSGKGCRTRGADWIALGSNTQSPEANTGYFDLPYWVTQATWSSPVTNKLLLEAGYSRFAYYTNNGPGIVAPDGVFDQIPVTEQSAIDRHNANFNYRAVGTYFDNYANPTNWRASASYVTGSHNMKIGYQGGYSISNTMTRTNSTLLAYRFNNRAANAFTYRLPNFEVADRTATEALFVQDTWTHKRFTLQGALRYDRVWSFSPAEHNGTTETSRFNTSPITLPETKGVDAYNDISPRFGVAYDLFGNGKTALKFNIGRYLAPGTNDTIYTMNNPANRIVNNVANRSWSDTNGNFIVDCDINNPAQQTVPGGDTCGANTGNSLNFGRAGTSTRVNPDLLRGWGVRPVDYQYGINVQHQLAPRVSLDVGYNRRWWGNFTVFDNVAVGPSDYEKWVYTAPKDARLPDGGGYPIAVYTLTAAAAARPADNYVTFESDYGDARKRYWHGVDVTLNARLKNNLFLQGGTATGRQVVDTCASVLKIDSPDPRFCHDVEPFQTALRGSASYTVPKVGVLVSATVRTQPPLFRDGVNPPGVTTNTGSVRGGTNPSGANIQVPNTVVQSILGRLPPGGLANGTTTIALLDNFDHRLYADNRRTQVDMRFAKVVRFNGRRADIGVDLYNLLNANYVNQATAYENQYDFVVPNGGTWNNPTTILAPRVARFNVTFAF